MTGLGAGFRYYVYGFTRPGAVVAGGVAAAGVGDLPVRLLGPGDVAALVSPWEGPPPDLTRPHLLAHARVVAAAHEAGGCLPCPAGTVETDAALATWLEQRAPLLATALSRLAGMVEFSLKFWAATAPASPAVPAGGREYLRQLQGQATARRRLEAQARALTAAFTAGLGGMLVETREADGQLHRVELLVPRTATAAVVDGFRQLEARRPTELGMSLSGPWPPYYFAGVMIHGRRTVAGLAERPLAAAPDAAATAVERLPG